MERYELDRKLKLLIEKLQTGEFKISPHLAHGFKDSISKIKFADDGNVIAETVDSRIRSTLHAVTFFSDRQDVKKRISLAEIQQAYFDRVDKVFGELFSFMNENESDPISVASWYASDDSKIAKSLDDIEEFLNSNNDFWDIISAPTWIHLEDANTSKAVFSGEIFPQGDTRVTNSTGIYFDTTILPDPFLRLSPFRLFSDRKNLVYEIIKEGLHVMSYKELALVELPQPIVAVLPDRYSLEDTFKEFIDYFAMRDTLTHACKIFGKDFEDIEELKVFLSQFADANSLVKQLKIPSGLLFDTEWEGDLQSHIERYMKNEIINELAESVGEAIYLHLYNRFAQSNDAFQRSKELKGTPIIKAETSWYWFNLMLQYNSKYSSGIEKEILHIARAFDGSKNEKISWINNVSSDALIEIRKQGALDEIRELLGKGISDLVSLEPNNFFQTSEAVLNNLENAFADHEKRIENLKAKKWKFAGKDLGSFIGVGGISIAAAITGQPLIGALAVSAGMSGYVPTFKELSEKLKSIRSKKIEYENTGIGILLKQKS